MIIDFHTHIYPEKIASRAVTNIGEFYQIPMAGNGGIGDLLERSGQCGIDRLVVFSAAALPTQAASVNNFIAAVVKEDPLRLTGFGSLHRDLENPEEEINRIISLGLRGIKLHPDMQKIDIDDPGMMRIYPMLEGRLPVIFHTGDYRYPYSHPAKLARVLDAFPDLTVVAAHFGGWSLFDLALECFLERRCYLDLSSSLPFLGKQRARELIRLYGAERILFGSDYPMWDPSRCLADFLALDLTAEEQELILYRNAADILGL